MKALITLLFLLGGLAGSYAQGGTSEAIESGITMRMSAPFASNGERKFLLGFSTNDVYDCLGTFIENDVRLQGNTLLVKLKSVSSPKQCVPTMGPATANIDLTSLKPGNYPVRVTINKQVFKADLEVTPTYYNFVVDNEDPSLFRIWNGKLNVIPANSIWGISAYSNPAQKADAEKFMKDLQAAGAQATALPAGNYDDFYLHEAGKTQEKVISQTRYEYPFVYTYSGNLEVIKELVNSYRGKLEITYRNSKGVTVKNF